MGSSWYYRWGTSEIGPIPSRELLRRARRHEIAPETEVRSADSDRWVAAIHIQGLFGPKKGSGSQSSVSERPAPVASTSAQSPPRSSPATGPQENADALLPPSLRPSPPPLKPTTRSTTETASGDMAAAPIGTTDKQDALGVASQSSPQPLVSGTVPESAEPAQASAGKKNMWLRWATGSLAVLVVLVVVGVNIAMILLDSPDNPTQKVASRSPVRGISNDEDDDAIEDSDMADVESPGTADDTEDEHAAANVNRPETNSQSATPEPSVDDDSAKWQEPNQDGLLSPNDSSNDEVPAPPPDIPETPDVTGAPESSGPDMPTESDEPEDMLPNTGTDPAAPVELAADRSAPVQRVHDKLAPEVEPPGVEASEVADERLARMTEIHKSILSLQDQWKALEQEIQADRAKDAELQKQYQQILINTKLLQRQVAEVTQSYMNELSRPGGGHPRQYKLRLGTLETQLQGLQVQGGMLEQQSRQINMKVTQTHTQQLALNREAEEWYGEWFLLSDPFGQLNVETHQRGKTLFEKWRHENEELPLPHMAHGFACVRLNQYQEGLRDFAEVEKLFSASPEPNRQMGALMAAAKGYALRLQARQLELQADRGNDPNVARQITDALGTASRRDSRLGLVNLFRARVLMLDGEHVKALSELKKGLQLAERAEEQPASMVAFYHNELARFLASCPYDSVRNGTQAVKHATQACHMTDWRKWPYLETLAMAHSETGDFDEALKWLAKAREGAATADHPPLEEKHALFEQHRPYRIGQTQDAEGMNQAVAERN